eukprot:CAMPEP_0181296760 /NCGR_PEP_ID=MMETSP1101-20121128/4874_1 /TAXON_ID=46948 /ORGANISM="Rhodomonas abbreviata, Strain Caron Lab Isolate" /LENGTH=346 /DNA_ID=CAMNT_0023401643 /DNA_START=278 /DNA_END=1314 /DNA_ORIENTATION=+
MAITASTAFFATGHLCTDLAVLCVKDSSEKYKQHASRMQQQLEPIWEAAWGKRSESRPTRTVFLSSREPTSTELSQSLTASSLGVLLISWKDHLDETHDGTLDDYRVLILKIESLTGRMPMVVVYGHSESRGGKDACSASFLEKVRVLPGTMRLVKEHIITLDMRINKAQQNAFFDIFAESAVQDAVKPVAAESVTVLSEDEGDASSFSKSAAATIRAAGMKDRPLNQLRIMSREDEFSVNPKSLYIVVVKAEEKTIMGNEDDGDYRMVLHRILLHTGRVPIVAICGDTIADGQEALLSARFHSLARLPTLSRYMSYALSFNRELNPLQLNWLSCIVAADLIETTG